MATGPIATRGALKAQQAYWIQQLEGSSVLELPADRPRPAAKTYNGSALHQFINKEQLDQLKNLGQEQGATLFMGLLILCRHSPA